MKLITLLLLAAFPTLIFSQTEFRNPWTNPETVIVIDAYEGNEIDWDQLQTDKRVVAVIHRATIGFRVDKKVAERRLEAEKRGFLWGTYHLGKKGKPVEQADFYLEHAEPESKDLMVIDIEAVGGNNMSLTDSVLFSERIREKTGRYPLFYSNHTVAQTVSDEFGTSSVFEELPLWYARFRDDIPNFPKGTWNSYTLWQFACEINCAQRVKRDGKSRYDCSKTKPGCPFEVPGTDRCIDVNVYNGSEQELRDAWPFTIRKIPLRAATRRVRVLPGLP